MSVCHGCVGVGLLAVYDTLGNWARLAYGLGELTGRGDGLY